MKRPNERKDTPLEMEKESGKQHLTLRAHTMPSDEIIKELSTDPQHGLSLVEAQTRLSIYGRNELESSVDVQPMLVLLHQVTNAMMIVSLPSIFPNMTSFLCLDLGSYDSHDRQLCNSVVD